MVHLEVVAGAGYRLAGEQVTVARFSGASKALDSWGIEVPLSIGLAF